MDQHLSRSELREQTQNALRAWHKVAAGDTERAMDLLPHLLLVQEQRAAAADTSPAMLRWATNEVLLRCLQALALRNGEGAEILRSRFIDQNIAQKVAYEKGLSRDQINRRQTQAIAELAQILYDQEQACRCQRVLTVTNTLEPSSYSELFGTESQQQSLWGQLLENGTPWVVVVTGIGGIGKTSLADLITRELIATFHYEQIIWLRLEASTQALHDSPQMMFDAVMTQLAQRFYPGWTPASQGESAQLKVRRVLKTTRTLIVLDNLEMEADMAYLLAHLGELANPSKFLLTSRVQPPRQANVYTLPLQELTLSAAAKLIHHHAQTIGLSDLADAATELTDRIYQVTGGNPLALKLVVGLAADFPLDLIINDLGKAHMGEIERLYRHIFWKSWQSLSTEAQTLLEIMPLAADVGMEIEQMQVVSRLAETAFWPALSQLIHRSLLEARGSIQTRRYGIHRLTQSFLQTEITHWAPEQVI